MKSQIHYFLVFLFFVSCTGKNKEVRETINLKGNWDIEESSTINLPENYTHTCVVPGLVDMAIPSFDSVGVKYPKRNFYNYHRTFELPQDLPSVVLLKVHKATYGTRVFINGQEAGYNPFCFTPGLFDIRKFLKPGKKNDITLQIGAYLDNIPDSIPNGRDFEKIKYIAGVFDKVEIILSGYPYIQNVQVVPNIKLKQIRVVAEIESDKDSSGFCLNYLVNEAKSGNKAGQGITPSQSLKKGMNKLDFTIPINNCKLWSPEDPFLYSLSISTGSDSKTERFGMRSFRFDKDKKIALLNEKPYAMLGTNVCLYRFFEDPSRDSLPWNYDWVKKLHMRFKEMNWNCIRYCIGFPPEQWYEIADETGFLIQDEYPVWTSKDSLLNNRLNTNSLIVEYTRWMRERWNHPCVVLWDAQNESVTGKTGEALTKVRELDLSNRPWDNGYAAPQSETDCIESHPYLFSWYHHLWMTPPKTNPPGGYMKEFFDQERQPGNDPNELSPSKNGRYNNPIIINEYDWLWINRDGTPTILTDDIYKVLFNYPKINEKEIRIVHAENVGLLTEYWRCHRSAVAIMHFCGLGYSRSKEPRGQTSDNFIDIKNLEFDPWFYKIVKNKFAPLCIMIDKWDKSYPAGELTVPVYVINDLQNNWDGKLTVRVSDYFNQIESSSAKLTIEANGRTIQNFKINIPQKPGDYKMEAEIIFQNDTIKSIRKYKVL